MSRRFLNGVTATTITATNVNASIVSASTYVTSNQLQSYTTQDVNNIYAVTATGQTADAIYVYGQDVATNVFNVTPSGNVSAYGTITASTINPVQLQVNGVAATSTTTVNAVVLRDSAGDFSTRNIMATSVTATTITATTHAGASSIYNATSASGTLTIGNTAVNTGVSAVLNLGTAGPGYTGVNTVNIGTGTSGNGATNVVNIATSAPANSGYNTVNIATGTPSTSTRQTVTIGNSTSTTVNISGSSITLGSFTTTNITATNFIVTGTASAIGTSAAYSGSTLSLGAVSTGASAQEGAQIGMGRSSDNTNAWYMDVYTPSTAAPTVTQLRFVDNNGAGNPVRLNMDTTGLVTVPGAFSVSGTASVSGTITGSSSLTIAGVIDGCTRINTNAKSSTTTEQAEGVYVGSNFILTTRNNSIPLYVHRYTTTGNGTMTQYIYNGTNSGTIYTTSGGTPAFAAASDYRAKTEITPLPDALERMKKANAYTFRKIASVDPEQNLQTGFIAHELADVHPDAVIGEKDAVDEDGNPVYQEVMEAKLIPVMAQAINDLIHKVEALEARVTELENK